MPVSLAIGVSGNLHFARLAFHWLSEHKRSLAKCWPCETGTIPQAVQVFPRQRSPKRGVARPGLVPAANQAEGQRPVTLEVAVVAEAERAKWEQAVTVGVAGRQLVYVS
jgi:hypothetical protein